MKAFAAVLALASLILCSTSCDKHSFESTQSLHESMHKAHDDGHHGDDHGKKDAHGAKKEEAKH